MKDLVIIGAGPAGITAAVYAARQKLDLAVVSRDIGGQAAWSGDIENYTGYQFITGPDLTSKFREHLQGFKFDLFEGEEVVAVEKENSNFKIQTSKQTLNSKCLIVASGKRPRMLNVPGEEKFKNRGVTYCATCDGPIFTGKDVAVIGGGNSALDAALQMMKLASKVYLINITSELGGEAVLREKIKADPKVEILNNTKTKEIRGDKFVSELVVEQAGKERTIPLKGIFVEIGLIPNSDLISIVKKNEQNEIEVDIHCRTSQEGIFAAGDVTNVPEKQIIIAAGEGAKAAMGAFKYLSKK